MSAVAASCAALRNLISKAMDAQKSGREFRVEVFREKDDMVLAVDDAGPGVPEEHRRRTFEPFFTTIAKGTRLGLAPGQPDRSGPRVVERSLRPRVAPPDPDLLP